MAKPHPTERVIATNRKALHEYAIEETLEAGIVLQGSEVKVLRAGKCTLTGAHVRVVGGVAQVMGLQIPEYPWAHQFNHAVERPRRLLLHAHEIEKLGVELRRKGTACVVTKLYWKGAKVKLELALGVGRKDHDKRAAIHDREAKRDIARALRR
ncbi:MAG: SsrA-binding protein SmpB [Myxococcales bacterium]|nr:SsrA-binding protein SmpB [Myxococcales bacterium]